MSMRFFSSSAVALSAFITAIVCSTAMAQIPEQSKAPAATTTASAKQPTFAEHKQKELDRIHKHQEAMKTLQSCVEAANDQPALKACNKTAHEAMKQMHHHDQ